MRTIDITEQEADFFRLIEQAAKGESFIVAKAGQPLVKVEAFDPRSPADTAKRRLGFLQGRITVPDDFDTLGQEEIEKMFYGEDKAD